LGGVEVRVKLDVWAWTRGPMPSATDRIMIGRTRVAMIGGLSLRIFDKRLARVGDITLGEAELFGFTESSRIVSWVLEIPFTRLVSLEN
jgi:hypothetical protein